MKASNGPRWSAVAVLLAALSLALAARPQNSRPETIRLVTLLGRPLPVAVAEMHGTFARYGVAVHFENMPNSDQLRATLKDGNADIAFAAVDNAVAMVELAGTDVVIVMGGEGSQNELMVQPDIKSIKDLRGKTLIVDAPNTAYALQMKKVLALNGLQAGKDYEIKPVGTTPVPCSARPRRCSRKSRASSVSARCRRLSARIKPPGILRSANGRRSIARLLPVISRPSLKLNDGSWIPSTNRKSSN